MDATAMKPAAAREPGGPGATAVPRRGLLVVAHPDDEVLWFSSVLESMATVVVCLLDYLPEPDLGAARRKALAGHPLPGIHCLGRAEAGSLDLADWRAPRLERSGLRLAPGAARHRYRRNGAWLRRRLPALLAGHDAVFSHSPWGEYGHEDHVQLHAVLRHACRDAGLDLWVPACCGAKARRLAERYRLRPGAPRLRLPTDRDLARRAREVYQRHGCWTWDDAWRWPEEESFLRAADLRRLPPRAAGRGQAGRQVEWMDC